MLKLDIGGEKNKHLHLRDGWIIVDVNPTADVVCMLGIDKLPFKDNSVDAIFTSHTMEHIPPHLQAFSWNEIYRVMKPGALIRVVVPDLDKAIQKYVSGDRAWFRQKGQPSPVPTLPKIDITYLSGYFFTYEQGKSNKNGLGLGGHVTPYNYEMANHYLTETKFKNIKQMGHQQCSLVFNGMDHERYSDYSVYVEAVK